MVATLRQERNKCFIGCRIARLKFDAGSKKSYSTIILDNSPENYTQILLRFSFQRSWHRILTFYAGIPDRKLSKWLDDYLTSINLIDSLKYDECFIRCMTLSGCGS